MNIHALQPVISDQLCAHVQLVEVPSTPMLAVSTPWAFPDGDAFQIYMQLQDGVYRLSDMGHVTTEISYERTDFEISDGMAEAIDDEARTVFGVEFAEGELFVETPEHGIADALFRLGQAMSATYALRRQIRQPRADSFDSQLNARIEQLVSTENVARSYVVGDIPNPDNYKVDFCISDQSIMDPLFVFGIHNGDKARLVTINLQYFKLHGVNFTDILVFEDRSSMPAQDLERITDVGGRQVLNLNGDLSSAFEEIRSGQFRRVATDTPTRDPIGF